MELTQIITIVTMIVTWILGIVSKKSKWVDNNLIPIQNILIGLVVAIIEWIITGDFSIALSASGLLAGGSYDVFHNIKKLINKNKEINVEVGLG